MGCGCGCGGEEVAYENWGAEDVSAAEYQGRSVTLNKPFRTPNANKKFGVYTKNGSGNVVLVRFGDPNMEIKRDDPARRKSFRSRHNCDTPGPKWKARYWSCYQWRSGAKVQSSEEPCGCGCEDDFEAEENEEIESLADERSTPAPPKDRKKGSKKNKPGSAKPGGSVTFSESVTKSLSNKVTEHNKKSSRKVTLAKLKAVYRRGAGAFSTSHRPGVSRGAWAMARVNAFLKLVRSGKPSNPKYVQDNDLLPSGHPRKSKKASYDEPCGCGCEDDIMAEMIEAEMIRRDVFDNPGEAQERAKELGLDGIHSHQEDGKTVFMPGKNHEEYMKKTGGKDVGKKEEVEGYYDDEKKKKNASYGDSCPPGKKMKDGKCVKVSVTLDLEIDEAESVLEASTGETIIRIKGIAFHEGVNKNRWSLTRAGAQNVVDNFVGTDLTLLHPKTNSRGSGFSRNMDGGVEEAIVGYVTSASMDEDDDGWLVRFEANVVRTELFEALGSGLWLREGYGVSIGGTGKPEVIKSSEEGHKIMVFGSEFNIDHLAIVHKPAYPKAKITDVERINKTEGFISSTSVRSGYQQVTIMTEDTIEIEANDNSALLAEMEAMRAELILANATIDEHNAIAAAAMEAERMALVTKASELGMKGHDELTTETLKGLIASWEAAHPEPTPVEMAPVEASTSHVEDAPIAHSGAVVANYLNGEMVKTPEAIYAKAYNMWVSNWNGSMAGEDIRAPSYEEAKERRMI